MILKETFKKHRTGAVPCCSSRCFDCMETDELRLGAATVAFSPECYDPPCCPHCKGWKTRMRMNCKRSLPNRTPRTCTTSRNLTWCTRSWRAWPEPSAPGWKNRTGRSKVKPVPQSSHSAPVGIWPRASLSWIMKCLTIFHLGFLNRVLHSPKTWHHQVGKESRWATVCEGGVLHSLDNSLHSVALRPPWFCLCVCF